VYVEKHFPMCIPDVTLVGNATYNWKPCESSRRPYPSADKAARKISSSCCAWIETDSRIANLFIWAPGTGLPAWFPAGKDKDPATKIFIDGTSFGMLYFAIILR